MEHRYDEFILRISKAPLFPWGGEIFPDDGTLEPCSNYPYGDTGEYYGSCNCCVTRSVVRIEYLGYQFRAHQRTKKSRVKPVPMLREVLSCGHSWEYTVGSYPWKKIPKRHACDACGRLLGCHKAQGPRK